MNGFYSDPEKFWNDLKNVSFKLILRIYILSTACEFIIRLVPQNHISTLVLVMA